MRIRKHARNSALLYATSSLEPGSVVQTHFCQLNQNPWDVMTFSPPSTPPPSSQLDGADAAAENGSSDGRCNSAVEREMKNNGHIHDLVGGRGSTGDHKIVSCNKEIMLPKADKKEQCCKTDGKSWRCRREAAAGSSLCDHHLSLVKNYQNLAHNATRKTGKPTTKRSSTRTKTPSSSGSHEFYYYSGFGPRWSRKRGQASKIDDDRDHERGMGPAISSQTDNYGDSSSEEDEEDEDEEYEEGNRGNGKKRVRKPVKARSLKSLIDVKE